MKIKVILLLFFFYCFPLFTENTRDSSGALPIIPGEEQIVFWQKLLHSARFETGTAGFVNDIIKLLNVFDLEGIFDHPGMYRLDDEYRVMFFYGDNSLPVYRIFRESPDNHRTINPGEFSLEVGIKKQTHDKKKSYPAFFHFKGITEDSSRIFFVPFFFNMNEAFLSVNSIPHYSREDKTLTFFYDTEEKMTLFFPRFMKQVRRYFPPVFRRSSPADLTFPINHLNIQIGYNAAALKKDFPLIYQYIIGQYNAYRLDCKVTTPDDLNAVLFSIDCESGIINLEMFIGPRGMVPFNDLKETFFEKQLIYDTDTLVNLEYHINFSSSIKGIHLQLRDLTIEQAVGFKGISGEAIYRITGIQEIKLSGMAYHIIPLWLIDLFIPGSIEQQITDSMKLLVAANKGEGSFLKIEWQPGAGEYTNLDIYGSSEYFKTDLPVPVLKTIKNKFFADRETIKEMIDLATILVNALYTDVVN